jgi:NADPH2:quinone reductase
MKDVLPVEHPFIPGIDVSGVVEAVGERVGRFSVGTPIIAWQGVPSGALAEYVLVKDVPSAAVRPAGLDAVHGAGLPTAALTAAALLDLMQIRSGATLLVVGATGGVGSYVVQLAKQAGLTVLATGRAEDKEYLDRLGADDVVDRDTDIAESTIRIVPGGVDVAIDLVNAGPALAATAAAVRPAGQVISPKGRTAGLRARRDRRLWGNYGPGWPARPTRRDRCGRPAAGGDQRQLPLRRREAGAPGLRDTPRSRQIAVTF